MSPRAALLAVATAAIAFAVLSLVLPRKGENGTAGRHSAGPPPEGK